MTAGCSIASRLGVGANDDKKSSDGRSFGPPEALGRLGNTLISESSGLTASKCLDGVYWTHNDSGGSNVVFAIDQSGKMLGRWKVSGADNKDWEDIAATKDPSGKCFLFIGDIGNNSLNKSELTVYRVEEPSLGDGNQQLETKPADAVRFKYPDGLSDSEVLLVHPTSENVYVVTKQMVGAAGVYKIPSDFSSKSTVTAVKIAAVSFSSLPGGLFTGGDISPDGKHLLLCDYFSGYELTLPSNSTSFDDIWSQEAQEVDLGRRKQGEAVTYASDGRSILATSEGKGEQIIKVSVR